MNKIDVKFPQFRKIAGREVWYKILSLTAFDELQRMGNRLVKYTITAEQYPEKLRILDMLSCQDPFIEITAIDYEEIEKHLSE
jgi:hypothetical protein